jgi:hypothetical protein
MSPWSFPRFLRIRPALNAAARASALVILGFVALPAMADPGDTNYPAASRTPASQSGWQAAPDELDTDAPPDEAQGGMTERGTPISKRTEECFPAERRDVFKDVDSVPGPDGLPHPFDYLDGGTVSAEARNAIRGKNTWIMWGEGNEAFWGWVQEKGYGLDDFLILIDSRARGHRFADAGLINQPGMKAQTDPSKKILGLYIDQANDEPNGTHITLEQPDSDKDYDTSKLATRPEPPPSPHPTELFTPGDRALYESTIKALPNDGVDPTVYGYPTGVVGLRLMPNPDFFGNTPAAQKARDYWQKRVVDQGDAYYTDPNINVDPDLVRPFRVSMSCGFCHVGPHPLFPPKDSEAPEWVNLSSTIGNQYWTPQRPSRISRSPRVFCISSWPASSPAPSTRPWSARTTSTTRIPSTPSSTCWRAWSAPC